MRATVFLRSSVFLLLLISCQQQKTQPIPFYDSADFTPLFLTQSQADNSIRHKISSFSLTDENGKPFTNSSISGKIYVADFIFTSCGSICPKMTDQMKLVGTAFEKDTSVAIVSYSVTPWIDTPEILRNYKHTKGITKPDWHFVTGNKAEIYDLARRGYFAEEKLGFSKNSSEFLHTEHFILVDAKGRIRGIYNGTLALEAKQLIDDIQELKKEVK
ncbi:SCO family protein [Flavobacterium silvaticum]|uniref:SCO family protein n=1 Tax=Flavobacterium silvaticum TaxID=1852020 RepID=A0A972JG05_9FLAO|nr:SCO family protein [Flavobacterium silvaticum]NMH28529.1 SCO family protein [Flavobacterium silvaticum]